MGQGQGQTHAVLLLSLGQCGEAWGNECESRLVRAWHRAEDKQCFAESFDTEGMKTSGVHFF